MTTLVTENLALVTEAPDGVDLLRALILELAVSGQLLPSDGEAKELRIEEFCSVQGGIQKTPLRTPVKHHFPYLRVANVQRGRIDTTRLERYELLPEELDRWRLESGDLLIVEGNGSESEIGRCAIWRGEVPNCVFQNHLMRVRPGRESNVEFLALYLNSPVGTAHMRRLAITTSGLFNLSVGKIRSIPVLLPPLPEQHRIVAKVDELMALCDRLEARQQDAEAAHARLVQALLDSLTQARDADEFKARWQRLAGQFDTLFASEDSVSSLHQAVIDFAVSGKFRPRNVLTEWCDGQLGDLVVNSSSGWSPSCEPRQRADGAWGVLKVSAVSWGRFLPDENKALPASLAARPELEVRPGDFLISRANTADLVARSVFVEQTPPKLMLSDKIVRLRFSDTCEPRFAQLANSSTAARRYYAEVAGGTSSSMKNVTRAQILALPIRFPSLAEQCRIVAKVTELLALCDQLKARITAARAKHAQLAKALVEAAVA